MKRSHTFSLAFIGLLLFPFITVMTAGEVDPVTTFNIRGIKLGMQRDEVKAILQRDPQCFSDYKQRNIALNCIFNAPALDVSLTDEPYGSGVFDIDYMVNAGTVDRSIFVSQLKADLRKKYDNPSYEADLKDDLYFACWGKSCKTGMEKQIRSPGGRKIPLAENKQIPSDRYLVVSFYEVMFGRYNLEFSLFDMNPYYVEAEESRKREVERNKKSIKF